ncbi:MAG TPA: DNA polymerase IV [Halieaceae bacterium]|nr:DNA polymerase IV [Halieaceae bacterium]
MSRPQFLSWLLIPLNNPGENQSAIRKIIHIDMDAFYASVEQRDNPKLRGRPIAVGGAQQRGVVAAASYEARVFGVKSAMPSVTAQRLCPDLIFVKARFEVYRGISDHIRSIFARYTDLIEPLSLDEAYLDVTEDKLGVGSAVKIAQQIRAAIAEELNLTASAGISYNKFLAKIASDQNKPNGQCVVLPGEGERFVDALPVRRFYGVGPKTAERMAQLNLNTGADLKSCSLRFLAEHFGRSAEYLYFACRGIDDRPVRPNRVRKSVGAERTYAQDLTTLEAMEQALEALSEDIWQRLYKHGCLGRTATLKIKFADFEQITRALSLDDNIGSQAHLRDLLLNLLRKEWPLAKPVRLMGGQVSGLVHFEPTSASAQSSDAVEEHAMQYSLSFEA